MADSAETPGLVGAQDRIRVLVIVATLFALTVAGHALFDESGPGEPIDEPIEAPQAGVAIEDTTSAGEGIQAIAAVVQVLALIGGGIWAYYVYVTSRRNRTTLGIEGGSRIIASPDLGRILLVRMRITNASNAVYHNHRATARLMVVRGWSDEGPILVPFGWQDPFKPVYGHPSEDLREIAAGRLLGYRDEGQPIILEPGEGVETELAFQLLEEPPLLAMQVRIQGWEREPEGQKWIWSSFFFIDGASGEMTRLPAAQGTLSTGDTIGAR